jgi:hypothetical protein
MKLQKYQFIKFINSRVLLILGLLLLGLHIQGCSTPAKRSFASSKWGAIPVDKTQLIQKMEWEVRAIPKAIKVCEKKHGVIRILNINQNLQHQIESSKKEYSKMRVLCHPRKYQAI